MSEEKYPGYDRSARNLFLEEDEPPPVDVENLADAPARTLRGVARQLWAAAALIAPLVQGDVDATDAAESIEAVLHQAGAQVEALIGELHALEDSIGKTPLVRMMPEHVGLDFPTLAAGIPAGHYREHAYQTVAHAALWHLQRAGHAAGVIGDYVRNSLGLPLEKHAATSPAADPKRRKILADLGRELERHETPLLLGLLAQLRTEANATNPPPKKNAPKTDQGFAGRKRKSTH